MAGIVGLEVFPESLTVAAGEKGEFTATVRNLGRSGDQLVISIEGLYPTWYTLAVTSTFLFPIDSNELKIIIHPPEVAGTKAGSYPFKVKVTSQENPEEVATADLTIEIPAQPPEITSFKVTTEDRRTFTLTWSVERAADVKLNDEAVDLA